MKNIIPREAKTQFNLQVFWVCETLLFAHLHGKNARGGRRAIKRISILYCIFKTFLGRIYPKPDVYNERRMRLIIIIITKLKLNCAVCA